MDKKVEKFGSVTFITTLSHVLTTPSLISPINGSSLCVCTWLYVRVHVTVCALARLPSFHLHTAAELRCKPARMEGVLSFTVSRSSLTSLLCVSCTNIFPPEKQTNKQTLSSGSGWPVNWFAFTGIYTPAWPSLYEWCSKGSKQRSRAVCSWHEEGALKPECVDFFLRIYKTKDKRKKNRLPFETVRVKNMDQTISLHQAKKTTK